MKHLFCHSVYHDTERLPGSTAEVLDALDDIGADGIELLTGYSDPGDVYGKAVAGVHLPYATDWFSAWSGTAVTDGMDDGFVRYQHFGRSRKEMVRNIETALRHASVLDPAYGVMHAGSVHTDDIFSGNAECDDVDVMEALCDMMNSAVSAFPDGEPPFTIVFENLWWSGMRLTDPRDVGILESRLDFDDWGLCVDTGHMMASLGGFADERDAVDALLRIFDGYPDGMKGRVITMHLHSAVSEERPSPPGRMPESREERMRAAYEYVSKLDPHRPFRTKACTELVAALGPEYVTHEVTSMDWGSRRSDFMGQRGMFV